MALDLALMFQIFWGMNFLFEYASWLDPGYDPGDLRDSSVHMIADDKEIQNEKILLVPR